MRSTKPGNKIERSTYLEKHSVSRYQWWVGTSAGISSENRSALWMPGWLETVMTIQN